MVTSSTLDNSIIPSLENKLWNNVKILSVDECWIYTKGKTSGGYGCFYINGYSSVGAHVVALALKLGYWPKYTLHKCDNPPCCNPKHLYEGSLSRNSKDAIKRGRRQTFVGNHRKGLRPRAKLTAEKVKIIKSQLLLKPKNINVTTHRRVIAQTFNVTLSTISSIDIGTSWKDV